MAKLLIVTDGAFAVSGRRVIVTPDIPRHELPEPRPKTVILRRPDGATCTVQATFNIPFLDPPFPFLEHMHTVGYVCFLKGVEKAAVPVGTEVWVSEE